MSIVYKKLIMVRPTKFVEFKFCKLCHKELNYKKFRIVKPLTKGPKKW